MVNWQQKPHYGSTPNGISLLKNMQEAYRNV